MSWSSITKKNSSTKSTQENFKKSVLEDCLLASNEIADASDISKINKEETLFNDLLGIKEHTEQFTPWLLSTASTYNILDFLYNYIDLDSNIESDNDSEDFIEDD